MKLGYHSITWGGVVGHPVGVTSIKDLFYVSNGSVEDAIRDIGSLGYQGTEMFDGNVAAYADEPEKLTSLLNANNLELVSVYTGANFIFADILPEEMWRIRRAAELAQQFGASRLVVGGGARRAAGTTDDDYKRLAEGLDLVVDIAESHGLLASYHPHLTTIVESPEEVARVLDMSSIGFCPDTGHLAAGGGDPAALIRAYPDRLRYVHLKDWRPDPFEWQPLGRGVLDFRDIITAVSETGYDSWLMVELDSFNGDPRDAAEISKRYLDSLLAEIGLA